VAAVDYSPSEEEGSTVQLWDPITGDSLGELPHLFDYFIQAEFSPDGQLLVTSEWDPRVADARFWLWSLDPPRRLEFPIRPVEGVVEVAFSADQDVLATSTGNEIQMWELATGEPLGRPITAGSGAMTFSPDGTLLATAGSDASLRLWDAATGDPIGGPLVGHDTNLASVEFSPESDLILTLDHGGGLRLWSFDVDTACALTGKYVSLAQVQPYLPAGWDPECRYLE
jgi:WD40 repeat protein